MGMAHSAQRMRWLDTQTGRCRDWRIAIAIGLAFGVFYSGFTQAKFKSSDAVGVFAVTESLFERQSLEIPIHHHAHLGADGRLYHAWAIGQSVLALPLYGLGKLAKSTLPEPWVRALAGRKISHTRRLRQGRVDELRDAGLGEIRQQTLEYGGTLEIFFVCLFAPLSGGALIAAFYLLQRRLGASTRSALIAASLTGLCGYAATMSIYFLRHTAETLALLIAFGLFHRYRETGSLRLLALGSLAAASIFLVRFPGVLCGPGLAIYLLWCIRERSRIAPEPISRTLAPILGPLSAAVALHCTLNYVRWGTWLGSPMTRGGFETSESFWTALSAFAWSPGIGVFAYSPLLLLLPWTLPALWQKRRWECIAFVTIAVSELLYFSNYRFWTGLWSAPGPRYLFPASILLMLPLGLWLDRPLTHIRQVAVWGLATVGAITQLALLTGTWSAVVRSVDTSSDFSFLFVPDSSPIIDSARLALQGQIDSWLWVLANGWPGHPPQPAAAVVLTGAWLATTAALFVWVRRMAGGGPRPRSDGVVRAPR